MKSFFQYIRLFMLLGVLWISCNTSQNIKFSNNSIVGLWCSTSNTTDYPHLTFRQDGYVIFDCKIDTVLGMRYSISNNYLKLKFKKKPTIKNKILKLSQDSLVFESLLQLQTKQIYYRCQE